MIIAAMLEFGNDEAYYFLYALDLQQNYFDHPPGVAWLIRIFTFNLLLTDEFFVRLGAIASSALATYLIYRLGTKLKNEQTGWFAAILYTSSLYTSLIAGTFIIPDSPQVVAWLASLLIMHTIVSTSDEEGVPMRLWLLFGLLAGITILCKVHGIFLWFSLGLYVVLFARKCLLSPGIYLSAVVTAVVISPILIWNVQNDFITYRFHSNRVDVEEAWIHLDYFFQAIGGQLLYSNPVNAVLILMAAWKLKTMTYFSTASLRFVLINGVPLVAVVTFMALFNSMLPHWSGPGILVLSLLAAAFLDERLAVTPDAREPKVLRWSLFTVAGLAILTVLLVELYPGTLGKENKRRFGEDDFTLDLDGWSRFSSEFRSWLKEEEGHGRIPGGLSLVAGKWFPAAHVEYYVARPLQKPVVGIGLLNDLHHYYWLNQQRPVLRRGDDALCIVPSNYPMVLETQAHFESAELLKVFYSYRSGRMVRYFSVYRFKNFRADDEAHTGVKPVRIP